MKKKKNILFFMIFVCIVNINMFADVDHYFDYQFYNYQKPEAFNKGKIYIRDVNNLRPEKRGGLKGTAFGRKALGVFNFNESVSDIIKGIVTEELQNAGFEVIKKIEKNIPVMDIDINYFYLSGYDWYGYKSDFTIKVYNDKDNPDPAYLKGFIATTGFYYDSEDTFDMTISRMFNEICRQLKVAFNDNNFEDSIVAGKSYIEKSLINTDFEFLQIDDLTSDIENKEKIKGISFFNNTFSNIPVIVNEMKQLEYLNLSFNLIKEIKNLENLIDLKDLDFDNNSISKIGGINNLVKLETLSLCENKIKKIENIDNLVNLNVLLLGKNNINKIETLDKFSKLEWLDLSSNRIRKIENLDSLQELNFIDLNKNNIRKIEGLDKLKNIEILILSNNNIKKIENISNLEMLSTLGLKDNDLVKIEGLENLKKLRKLDLGENDIAKIDNLDNLTNLEELNLNDNEIKKIEGLDNLKKLKILKLSENKIKRIENLEHLESLKTLEIDKVFTISQESYDFLKNNYIRVNGRNIDYWMKENNVRIKK